MSKKIVYGPYRPVVPDPAVLARAAELYQSGMAASEIVKKMHLNVCFATLLRWLRNHGIDIRDNPKCRKKEATEKRRRIVEMVISGNTDKEIASALGTTSKSISFQVSRCRDEPEFRDALQEFGDRRYRRRARRPDQIPAVPPPVPRTL